MIPVIDVAKYQINLDFNLPWAEGYRACYVKLGGDNAGRYVADTYARLVDKARAVGYRVGHYWVPNNSQDPVAAADYFVNNLRGVTSKDFYVLDNENLDGATKYTDARAAIWVKRVMQRLNVPASQVMVYSGLNDARNNSWPEVLATGTNFIIAAYSYPAFQFPSFASIPMSRIVGHQTGGKLFGGVATDINSFKDNAFNYDSGSDVVTLALVDKARAFAQKYPRSMDHPNGGDANWDQDCGRLMFRFGEYLGWISEPVGDISSAYRAYKGSTIISKDPTTAPIGAYHWWDIGGAANGHVAQQVDDGTLVFMGNWNVQEDLGLTSFVGAKTGIGFGTVAYYNSKKPEAVYLGWSKDYSGGRAKMPYRVIQNKKGKKMFLAWTTDGTGWLVTEDGWHGLPSMQVYNLFKRLIISDQEATQPETFLRAEVDIMAAQLNLLRTANRLDVQIDPVKLASAVVDALNAQGGVPVTVENLADADFEVDPEALAVAFDAVVPRVAAAIVKAAGQAMAGDPVDPA